MPTTTSDEAAAAHDARFASLELQMERLDDRLAAIQWALALLIGAVASLILKAFA